MSEVSYSLTQDKRDSRFDAREGYLWSITESVAGIGGDVQYLRSTVRGQYLYPMFYKRAVLGFDAEAGIIDGLGDKVARSTRFLIGGRKVRGFDAGGIGPRDTGDNSAIGGNKYYTGSVNLISDLGLDPDLGVRWTVFADAGAVWATDYPSGVKGLMTTILVHLLVMGSFGIRQLVQCLSSGLILSTSSHMIRQEHSSSALVVASNEDYRV